MTTNITATTLTAGQASKEATISQMIGELDAALSENFSADLTSGNVSITAAQLKGAQVFIAKNAPTTGRTVTFGTPSKRFISIQADASNTQNVSFVVGSTSLVIKPGSSKIVYLDGTTNGLALANIGSLSDLVDIDESTPPSNGDYLRYDASTGKFKPWQWGVTTQTGDYGFLLVDMNTTIEFNSAGNHIFTIPLNATIAFPVGIAIECIQLGLGHLTIAGAGGVTLDDITVATTAQYQRIIVRKVATDEWNVVLLAASGSGSSTLAGLTDVSLSGIATNKVLRYNGASYDFITLRESIIIAVGDETTAITTGAAKTTFRMPYAMTLTDIRASLTTASSSGLPQIDVKMGGTTILSTQITIDATEKTSTTAVTPPVISTTALTDDAEMTIDINTAGTGAAGLKISLIGTRA